MSSEYPFTDLPTIDDSVANPLKELLGDSYLELVNDFTSDFPIKFKALQIAANENDVDSIFKLSHTLKSSSGSFGFTRLYKRLEYLELQARTDEISDLTQQIDLIEQEFTIVLSMLNDE